MGVRIIDSDDGAVLYCSTTNWAFGPIFESYEHADAFCDWLPEDARIYKDNDLENKYCEFLEQICKLCDDPRCQMCEECNNQKCECKCDDL